MLQKRIQHSSRAIKMHKEFSWFCKIFVWFETVWTTATQIQYYSCNSQSHSHMSVEESSIYCIGWWRSCSVLATAANNKKKRAQNSGQQKFTREKKGREIKQKTDQKMVRSRRQLLSRNSWKLITTVCFRAGIFDCPKTVPSTTTKVQKRQTHSFDVVKCRLELNSVVRDEFLSGSTFIHFRAYSFPLFSCFSRTICHHLRWHILFVFISSRNFNIVL